jgi:hypothetical protein
MTQQDLRDVGSERLLLPPSTRVTCPKCEHEFSLAEGFARQSLEQLEQASVGALAQLQAEARTKARALEKQAADLRARELEDTLRERDAELAKAAEERKRIAARERAIAEQEAGLTARVEKEAAVRAQALAGETQAELREQLAAQANQLEEFRKAEMKLRRERSELEAKQAQLELDVQRRLDEERKQIADTARLAEAERARLKEADLQKKLDDMREQVEEMKRKAEQGSQQSQGEVLELLLEEQIGQAFPLDVIEEVKKGARGGDVVHRVMTRSEQQAGLILWEAKRAQNWSAQWPAKLKDDMREVGADLGVLVATSLPREFADGQQFGPHEDVWVTTPAMALQVAGLLRALVESVHKQKLIVANRGEQAEAVYDYLTSPTFAQKWKKVYDVFQAMRRELDSERTTAMQRWKRREKQMQQAVLTLAGVAGDIQGLAQQALPQLELEPEPAALEGPEDYDA